MLLHLETGCDTDIGQLDQLAAACSSWRAYVARAKWNELRASVQVGRSKDRIEMYNCPECREGFQYLSSLVQHVESDACQEGICEGSGSIGKLLHYLWTVL